MAGICKNEWVRYRNSGVLEGIPSGFVPGVELILPLEGRDELRNLSRGLPAL